MNPLTSRARSEFASLSHCYPDAHCELDFATPFQLLVATVLSAQSTDRRVNDVTRTLFARWPDADALASADTAEVEAVIKPVGFFRTKAAAITGLARQVVDEFEGTVPDTLEELVTLPGVGRKTANVVLGDAFGVPGITPDTHFVRVTHRLGWLAADGVPAHTTKAALKPDAVERAVGELFPASEWVQLSHVIIWHGRRRCHARNPACGACPVADSCPSFGAGQTDPKLAATLVREPRR